MDQPSSKTLILACGALAKEIVFLKDRLGRAADLYELKCLPAGYHNRPSKIVPNLKSILDKEGQAYETILIGYGDCGTGGALDRLLMGYPKATRLPGAHCYEFFAGSALFAATMEEELGSFFLTDYLVRHFDTLIIKGMGIDRFPELQQTYFEHYKRLVYFSQIEDANLIALAEKAAERLDLDFIYRHVGFGALETAISI